MKRLLGLATALFLGLGALTGAAQAQGTDLPDVIARGEIVVGVDMTTRPGAISTTSSSPTATASRSAN